MARSMVADNTENFIEAGKRYSLTHSLTHSLTSIPTYLLTYLLTY